MKKENLEDYELFYMEIPQADYFNDIEIQDEYENPDYNDIAGLSAEQVSQLATDSLDSANNQASAENSEDPKLFDSKSESN